MHTLSVLAAEGIKNRDLWYPTILGVLVVIAAVGLFVGTPILLLATNMGTRLGFLVGVACLSGLMVLISLLWLTNPSPVNTLKGRIPAWVAVESIQNGDVAKSKIAAVRDIDNGGHEASEADVTNLKAAVDSNLILTKNEQTGEILSGAEGKFAVYQLATDYLVKRNQLTGGGGLFSGTSVEFGGGWPWVHVSLHKPQYAVITTCKVDAALAPEEVPFGAKPPVPKCGDDSRQLLVLRRDLGSLRVPPFVAFLAFSLLFGLTLLSLHWRERDLQEAAARSPVKPTRSPRRPPNPPPSRSEESGDATQPLDDGRRAHRHPRRTRHAARRGLHRRPARRRRWRTRPGRPRLRAARAVLRPLHRRALLHGPCAPAAHGRGRRVTGISASPLDDPALQQDAHAARLHAPARGPTCRYSVAATSAASSTVRSITSSSCARETNIVS